MTERNVRGYCLERLVEAQGRARELQDVQGTFFLFGCGFGALATSAVWLLLTVIWSRP